MVTPFGSPFTTANCSAKVVCTERSVVASIIENVTESEEEQAPLSNPTAPLDVTYKRAVRRGRVNRNTPAFRDQGAQPAEVVHRSGNDQAAR